MPNHRPEYPYSKKACHCTHGIAIHHLKKTSAGMTHPCWFPGCKCKDYRSLKH